MRKIIYLLLLIALFNSSDLFASDESSCSYTDQIKECLEKQKTHRTIDDFVCIQGSYEQIVSQIILDDKFGDVDEEIESYLSNLSKSKDYYFGQDKISDFTSGLDLIEKKLGQTGEYSIRYKEICTTGEGGVIPDVLSCLGDKSSVLNTKNFLDNSKCENLYKLKLSIYKQVAINTLKKNKQKILKDSHKSFTQIQRDKFSNLVDLIRINIGYIERLWKKWPSKSKNNVH